MVRWLCVACLASSLTYVSAAIASEASAPGASVSAASASGTSGEASATTGAPAVAGGDRITLADLFRIARRESPTLATARSRVEAAEGRARQAGIYPNPVLGIEVEDASTADLDSRADKISLTQPLVLGGRRGAAVAEARARALAARHAREALERDVLEQVHARWVELLYFREADSLLVGLIETASRSLEVATARFEARAVPEAHVTRARLELYDLEASRRRLAGDRARAAAQLSRLVGGVEVPPDRLAGRLPDAPPPVAHGEIDIAAHPAVLASIRRTEAADAALRNAKAARVPDLGVFVAYGRSRPSNDHFFEAGVSIPLPIFDRRQGLVAERRALIDAEEADRRQTEDALRAELASTHARYDVLRDELLTLTTDISPAAERSVAQTRDGYWAGRTSFLEMIDAQRALGSVRLRRLELKRELTLTHAALASLAGRAPYAQTGD